jgi:transposase
MLKEELALVLYDVTTLYFETFKSDELRVGGFSKDNKLQQPQILLRLIVTRQGYPLSYEVFVGNTFEGKTMLSVLDNFTKKNGVDKPIVVADAAMLSYENIEELKQRNLSYIVGARSANTSLSIIKEASDKLQNKGGKSIRIKTEHGELIIEFSKKRYGKDKYEMEKQILKAKLLVEGKLSARRTKFIKYKNKENQYVINEALIEKARLLLGMKGYYTNIASTILSNQDIITRYHDLWHVEQTFQIAKSDLASRPVFHHKNQAVRSHILICFTALMFSKYLEIKSKLPINQVIDGIWNVTEAKLFNRVTSKTISLQSEVTSKSKDIIDLLNKSMSY